MGSKQVTAPWTKSVTCSLSKQAEPGMGIFRARNIDDV